jgi:hypothetical protein
VVAIMDKEFIKKVSRSLMIIGIVTIFFNSLMWLFIQSDPVVNYFTFLCVAISTVVMFIGTKKPINMIAYYQVISMYVIIFFSFLEKPGNLAGIFLSIINYILLSEYHITHKFWHRVVVIIVYLIPAVLSIVVFNKPFDDLPPVYLLTAFFSFFLYHFIVYKKERSFNTVNKSFELLTKLEPITDELLKNNKVQLDLIAKQSNELEQYRKNE